MKKEVGIAGFVIVAVVCLVITFIQKTAKEAIHQDFEQYLEDSSKKEQAKKDSIAQSIADYNKSMPIKINDEITLNSIQTTDSSVIIYPECYFTLKKLDEDKFKEKVTSFLDNTEPFKHWITEDVHFECSVISESNDTTYIFTYPSSTPSSLQ